MRTGSGLAALWSTMGKLRCPVLGVLALHFGKWFQSGWGNEVGSGNENR